MKLPASDRPDEWNSFPSAGSADVRRELLGSWLQSFPWDAFATYTFELPRSPGRALWWARRHLHQLNHWVGRSRPPGSPDRWARKPYAAVFHEIGPCGGRGHLHALVGNMRPFPAYCGNLLLPGVWAEHCCLAHSWLCGIARAVPYNPELGAAHYLTKYSVKSDGEWCFLGRPARPQKVLDNIQRDGAPSVLGGVAWNQRQKSIQ